MPLPKVIDLLRAGASGSNVFSTQATGGASYLTPTLSFETPSVASTIDSYIREISQPGDTLNWPTDLPPYHINIDIFNRNTGTSVLSGYGPGGTPRLVRIRLPIPSTPPNDMLAIKWMEQSWDFMTSMAGDYFKKRQSDKINNSPSAQRGASPSSATTGGLQNAFGLGTGVIVNTALAFMFQGPMYKGYRLGIIMAPRNEAESMTIRQILGWLRWGAATEYNEISGGLAFDYPSVFRLEYSDNITDPGSNVGGATALGGQRWQTTSKWQAFKPAVLHSVTVNYAPENHPIIMEGGYPEAVRVSLEFREIEYWLKRDFDSERNGSFRSGT